MEYPFLLIGSQAILAHLDPDYFPELVDCDFMFISREADIAVIVDDNDIQDMVADRISGVFGELSWFDRSHGYHADGVNLDTAILADGWKDRIKPYEAQGVPEGKFFALSYQDLAVSKLMAGRPKDLDFVRGMCQAQPHHPGLVAVEELLMSLPPTPQREVALSRWRAMVCRTPNPERRPNSPGTP